MVDEIKVKVTADTKQFNKAVKTSETETKKLGLTISKTAATAGLAFAALGAVITKKLIDAYAVQEQAEIRTRRTLEATGHAAGLTADELFKMASGLQEVTTFGDEVILGGQNMLLTFRNIGEDTFPRATEAMLDMSTAMGTDLKSSAIQLGKALNDPIQGMAALTRVGITFTEQQKETIKELQLTGDIAGAQAVILAELENQFGGVARAAAEGSGIFTQVGNIWGDIAEKLGGKLLPAAKATGKALAELGADINDALTDDTPAQKIDALAPKIEALVTQIANLRGRSFSSIAQRTADEKEAELKLLREQVAQEQAIIDEAEAKKTAIKQAAADKEAAAKEKQLAETATFAEALAALDQEQSDRKIEADATELERLQFQVDSEAMIKQNAKIKELQDSGKHEEALLLIKETGLKRRFAAAKKQQAIDLKNQADFFTAATSLANSENKSLAAIGKAAALTQLAIKTPEAVGNSYAFGTKFGGPVRGTVLAGIALTAMSAQAAKIAGVQGFADGGVIGGITGAKTGGDDQFATVKTGEMILNAKQQGELFEAIQSGNLGSSENGTTEIVLTMNENLVDFIEAEVIERRATGVSQL